LTDCASQALPFLRELDRRVTIDVRSKDEVFRLDPNPTQGVCVDASTAGASTERQEAS
jgi:hypothetical protein